MNAHHPWAVAALAVATLSIVPASARADSYTITDLGWLGGTNDGYRWAYDINASGQVVGQASKGDVGSSVERAFLSSNGLMSDLGTLGGSNSRANGINASGVVVGGAATVGDGRYHAFRYSNGVMSDLGTFDDTGYGYSVATGINASGQVTGSADDPESNGGRRAFLYSGGELLNLGTLNNIGEYTNSYAYGINDSGQVVGYAATGVGSSVTHAFLYANGVMNDIGTLNGDAGASVATAINNNGEVVGWSTPLNGGPRHAFLYANGLMTDIGLLLGNGTESWANDINNQGQIVGSIGLNLHHSFLYSEGVMTNLNSLLQSEGSVWDLYEVNAINDDGQIVGTGRRSGDTDYHAIRLTPVPLPAAVWLLGSGLAALFGFSRRRAA